MPTVYVWYAESLIKTYPEPYVQWSSHKHATQPIKEKLKDTIGGHTHPCGIWQLLVYEIYIHRNGE